MTTTSGTPAQLIGVWTSVADFPRSRAFYERIGASFDSDGPVDGIARATLGSAILIFEAGAGRARDSGPALLVGVPDADALHGEMIAAGISVEGPPRNERWGRQFDALDPDGNRLAFIGPLR